MNKKKNLLLIQKNKINDLFFITYVIVFEKYNKISMQVVPLKNGIAKITLAQS